MGEGEDARGEKGVGEGGRVRRGAGVLLGVLVTPLLLLHLPLALLPGGGGAGAAAVTDRLAALERARRTAFCGDRHPDRYRAEPRVLRRYLAARAGTGLVTAVVLGLVGCGALLAGLLAAGAVRGSLGWSELAGQVLLGGVLLFLAVQGLLSLAALETRLARDCFGPSETELLRRRVTELADSRAAVLHAVDAERRRIERDLHDGVQQRLVALRLLLARAGRGTDPRRTADLLGQAHREAGDLLTELREVAWRVHPSALDALGLDEALAGIAARAALPLRIHYAVPGPLPEAVRTAAYFVVSECVTNAAKHSGAAAVDVRVEQDGARLTVRVGDDGGGGADPAGGGLAGLRGRLAALDGTLHVHSPHGGPTVVTAELPCT
ncbi:hypothetical protein GCM10009759_17810 [Kitasatospora saccharophila]|uniref:histidine kinase n=1 Tax=Kitasatospora saccharophila TaxID=407973 RepID=A0ABN2WH40_9ACTN